MILQKINSNSAMAKFVCNANFLFAIFFIFACNKCDTLEIITLSGNNSWMVCNQNNSINIPAVVPGSIYTDLQKAGIISDPYYRFNDLAYRWVSYDNWTYSRIVNVAGSFLSHSSVVLVSEGLDTVATVTVNGFVVGHSDNMFRRQVIDVKNALQVGLNHIRVSFISAVLYAKAKASSYPFDVPEDCPPAAQRGECHFNFVRKQACSFSWDWGPAFPTMGIWRNISLEAYNTTVIRYLTVETWKSGEGWTVNGSVFFDVSQQKRIVGNIMLTISGVLSKKSHLVLTSENAVHHFSLTVQKAVHLWWPNGSGNSSLYQLSAFFSTDDDGAVQTSKSVRFGFRTVHLVQRPVAHSTGLSFYFRINDRSLFLKGANWIPADSFQERITETTLRNLLSSAVDANMNVLRVWGGGIYESDLFYTLADEFGVLIWQDLMFACSLYPTDDAFLHTVSQEITHQVRRLKHHPSIFIWAANNENEEEANRFRNSSNWQHYHDDYVKLYVKTVHEAVMQEDQSRPFVTSSPSNGRMTKSAGWISKDPQNLFYGDIHHYDYERNGWDVRVYSPPRFASEFGFQSWCSLESLVLVTVPSDWTINGHMASHRNHHTDGNKQMMKELSMNLKPPNGSNKTQNFIDFIYLTQINQAMSIKTETELYRRSQSGVNEQGQGYTMGALYWQLNDIWQAPSWSSLEYSGKWKMLHYYAKRFFRKVMLSATLDGDSVIVHLINDSLDSTPPGPADSPFTPGRPLQKSNVRRHKYSPKLMVAKGQSGGNHVMNVGSYVQSAAATFYRNIQKLVHTTLKFTPAKQKEPKNERKLVIQCFYWSELKSQKKWIKNFTVPKLSSAVVATLKLDMLLTECSCPSREHCVFSFDLDGPGDHATWLLVSKPRSIVGLRKPALKVATCVLIDNHTMSLTISTDAVALFVWLEAGGWPGHFSDNGFLMLRDEVPVRFHSRRSLFGMRTVFLQSLTIRSLADVSVTNY